MPRVARRHTADGRVEERALSQLWARIRGGKSREVRLDTTHLGKLRQGKVIDVSERALDRSIAIGVPVEPIVARLQVLDEGACGELSGPATFCSPHRARAGDPWRRGQFR